MVLAIPPDPKYKGEGDKTLIDFQRGGDTFRSGKWFGWQGYNCVATLYFLGEEKDVSRVTVGAYEDTGGWIFFPKGVRVSNFRHAKISSK